MSCADSFLTQAELAFLTGRRYPKYQSQALAEMGIPFFLNPLGRPIVLRSHFPKLSKPVEPVRPSSSWTPPNLTF